MRNLPAIMRETRERGVYAANADDSLWTIEQAKSRYALSRWYEATRKGSIRSPRLVKAPTLSDLAHKLTSL